jgi:nicotinamidase-related amidase
MSGAGEGLRHGALSASAMHLCVDMQRVFAEPTEWHAPWFDRVLPNVLTLVRSRPQRTIFTRFMPPPDAAARSGMWRHYFERWSQFTLKRADPAIFDLVSQLGDFVPPARVIDKPAYSPFHDTTLAAELRGQGVDTLVISGTETDVCVLAAALDAVDIGLRVIIADDAICSSSDETHDAIKTFFRTRLHEQVEIADAATILAHWPAATAVSEPY